MHIVMMTNTYLPHVSGVAQSVVRFVDAYRSRGHSALVVAPEFEGQPEEERDVVRMPAVQHFNGSDFSVALPMPMYLTGTLNDFKPDLIHSHHPFLMGDTALRVSAARQLPLVFTHHTMYEQYTHYVPMQALHLADAVIKLCTGYANLCDHVIAPSEAVKRLLRERGVGRPISVIPSGVDTEKFQKGGGETFRKEHGIPAGAFLVGHVGRLAPEKNLTLLAEALAMFFERHETAHGVITGAGVSEPAMRAILRDAGVGPRTHFTGPLSGDALVAAYDAFDVFLFTSKSETQGMVLVEAMAAGTPVVALKAPPVDEVVKDGRNGWLSTEESAPALADCLDRTASQAPVERSGRIQGTPYVINA